jgi:hypothetical protein
MVVRRSGIMSLIVSRRSMRDQCQRRGRGH